MQNDNDSADRIHNFEEYIVFLSNHQPLSAKPYQAWQQGNMFHIPATGIERTVLATYPVSELPGYESRLVLLAYAPGAKATLHNHPVPATGVVIKGKIISQFEAGQVETYIEGEGFTDLGVTPHLRSENASKTEPLLLVVNYVIKVGEPNINPL